MPLGEVIPPATVRGRERDLAPMGTAWTWPAPVSVK